MAYRIPIILLLAAVISSTAADALAKPPAAFYGAVSQGPLEGADFRRMERAGIGTLRVPVAWWAIQPARGADEWEGLDRLVAMAADHGVRLLPVVGGTPGWLSNDPARPPIESGEQRKAWSEFLRALVERYGSDGDFWADGTEPLAIRRWQIWNEPNFPRFYAPSPSPRGYARLVRNSAESIRSVDPRAEIVLAGVAPVGTGPPPATYLRDLYAIRGIKRDFDVVALHPYSRNVHRLGMQIRAVRRVMRDARDRRTPLELTEIGWASRVTQGEADTAAVRGLRGQARMLRLAFRLLERKRRAWRINGAHWFAWQDATAPEAHCSFCQFAGLLSADRKAKPAWRSYKRIAGR